METVKLTIMLLIIISIPYFIMGVFHSIRMRKFEKIILLIISLVGMVTFSHSYSHCIIEYINDNRKIEIININDNTELLYSLELNESNFKAVSKHYGVIHIDEVYNQALLETGNFTSKNCIERNNLLGLVAGNSKSNKSNPNGYYIFNHWTESILGYVTMVQYKIKSGEDYYDFLERIGYAEDSEYINKLKKMNNGN